MNSNVPEFGKRIAGVSYQSRPGAYGIVIDASGKVAIVNTSTGCYLPGGGIEANESPDAALIREVREECGWDITVLDKFAEAIQYVHATGEGYFAKQCAFYRFTVHQGGVGKVEENHQMLWLEIPDAIKRMKHESQAWAITQAVQRSVL